MKSRRTLTQDEVARFEFELDMDDCHETARRAAGLLDGGAPVTPMLFYWEAGRDLASWCMVFNHLSGETIRGVDWPMEVGEFYDLDVLHVPYHPVPVPVRVKVLAVATHADAERAAGRKLPRRAYYYKLSID